MRQPCTALGQSATVARGCSFDGDFGGSCFCVYDVSESQPDLAGGSRALYPAAASAGAGFGVDDDVAAPGALWAPCDFESSIFGGELRCKRTVCEDAVHKKTVFFCNGEQFFPEGERCLAHVLGVAMHCMRDDEAACTFAASRCPAMGMAVVDLRKGLYICAGKQSARACGELALNEEQAPCALCDVLGSRMHCSCGCRHTVCMMMREPAYKPTACRE